MFEQYPTELRCQLASMSMTSFWEHSHYEYIHFFHLVKDMLCNADSCVLVQLLVSRGFCNDLRTLKHEGDPEGV